MMQYDPMTQPPTDEWLALEEAEQIALVSAHHRPIEATIPRPEVHAVIHVVVENQLAEGIEPARDALERLLAQGLDRHEAIHAIASVLMEHMRILVQEKPTGPDPHERYFQDLKEMTADKWLKDDR
ncbi:MAG: hypothetical protein AB1646_26680 [Thermodesulfobacteriota bacterium]